MTTRAYVPDQTDRSRFGGKAVSFVARPEDLAENLDGVDLVIVDLSRPAVLAVLPRISARTIGFGSHVDRERLEDASAAGCDEVMARSEFFRRLEELLP
jgi:hypothetical protein